MWIFQSCLSFVTHSCIKQGHAKGHGKAGAHGEDVTTGAVFNLVQSRIDTRWIPLLPSKDSNRKDEESEWLSLVARKKQREYWSCARENMSNKISIHCHDFTSDQ